MAISLSPRLLALSSLVRPSAVLADIGTDHAYLPIFLIREGKILRAVASDVASGPLQRAKVHIAALSLQERIAVFKTNGLEQIEQFSPTDIVIAGMGGELIVEILSSSAYIRNSEIRLILQPMSKGEELTAFLANHGFFIEKELLCKEDRHFYRIIQASYRGKATSLSPFECLSTATEDPLYLPYLQTQEKKLLKIISGKKKSPSEDLQKEELLLRQIRQVLTKKGAKQHENY